MANCMMKWSIVEKYLSKLLDIANSTKKELVMIFLLRHLEARKLICSGRKYVSVNPRIKLKIMK